MSEIANTGEIAWLADKEGRGSFYPPVRIQDFTKDDNRGDRNEYPHDGCPVW